MTSIGNYAFSSCSSLTSVTIPNSVTSIGENAFGSCTSMTSLTIGNNVESIGYSAFSQCTSLTSVVIPSSVTRMGERVFYYCKSLSSVTIENSVISGYEFNGCTNLTSVVIPEGVKKIGYSAFGYCSALTSVVIPNSVKSIDGTAFVADYLTDVYCYAEDIPSTGNYVFTSSCIAPATLHVPAASIEAYRTTEPWSGFGSIVPLTDEDDIEDVNEDTQSVEVARYDLQGRRQSTPQRGINIIRMADGTTRKMMVK